MNTDELVAKTEGEAISKLIAAAAPTLYKDIEEHGKELKIITDWMQTHGQTEDVKTAGQLIVNRHKERRLSSELDALIAKKKDLESKALDFHRKSTDVIAAKDNLKVLEALKAKVNDVDEKYYFYIPSSLIFKMELDAEISRNQTLILQFEKDVLATSSFKMAKE